MAAIPGDTRPANRTASQFVNRIQPKLVKRVKLYTSNQPILEKYEREGSPYHSTARLWDDGIIDPLRTRDVLALAISASYNAPISPVRYGVFRM